MEIVIDTSALLAVILGEPQKETIVGLTARKRLIGPGSIPWEIGNAFSAILKRRRLNLETVLEGFRIFQAIPIRYVPVDFHRVLEITDKVRVYAYDAYFLDCALRHQAPILTLDQGMRQAARGLGIESLEV